MLTSTCTTQFAPAADFIEAPLLLPESSRCTYASKPCGNPRAIKLDKTLHRLCELHRRRANLNQQRMQQRRRLLRRHSSLSDVDASCSQSMGVHDHTFTAEELRVLEYMLFRSGSREFVDGMGDDNSDGNNTFATGFAAADWRLSS